MAIISDTAFFGAIPRMQSTALPPGYAESPWNIDCRHGDLRPTKQNLLSQSGIVVSSPKTIYSDDGENWVVSGDDDVEVVRHPTNGVPRYYFTHKGNLYASPFQYSSSFVSGTDSPPETLRVGLPAPTSPPSVAVTELSPWPVTIEWRFFVETKGSRETFEFTQADLVAAGGSIAAVSGTNNRQYDMTIPATVWPNDDSGVNRTDMYPVAVAVFKDSAGQELGRIYSTNSSMADSGSSTVTNVAVAEPVDPIEALLTACAAVAPGGVLDEETELALRAYGLELASLSSGDLATVSLAGSDGTRSAASRALAATALSSASYYNKVTTGSTTSVASLSFTAPQWQSYTDYDVRIECEVSTWHTDDVSGALVFRFHIQMGKLQSRAYCFTYINRWGDESPPSPVSEIVTLDAFQMVELNPTSSLTPAERAAYGIHGGRVYRTVTKSDGSTEFFFVYGSDASTDGAAYDWTTTLNDDIPDARLGEPLPTKEYEPPPAGIDGLTATPSGSLLAFSGDTVYMSVPYKPASWYSGCKLPETIKAVGQSGSGVIAATVNGFYVIQGDGDAMTAIKLPAAQALIGNKLLEMEGALLAPTNDGIAVINGANVDMSLSFKLVEKDDWTTLLGSYGEFNTFAYFDNKIIAFFATGGFVVDLRHGYAYAHDLANVTAARYIPRYDALYVAIGTSIYVYEGGTGSNSFVYKSKLHRMLKPTTMGVVSIVMGSGSVTFKLYGDGVLRHTKVVSATGVFRLPSGFSCTDWQYELSGTGTVKRIDIAASVSELQAV